MVCYSVSFGFQDIQEPDIDWDVAADGDGEDGEDVDGVLVVPEFDRPLNEQQLAEVQMLINENEGDTDNRNLYLLCRENVVSALSNTD